MSTNLPSPETSPANLVDPAAARPFGVNTRPNTLPDVAADAAPLVQGKLNRVGMSGIEVAIRLRESSGEMMRIPARVDAYVSVDDPEVKGIHMSRLYLSLQDSLDAEFGRDQIETILKRFLDTHADISATSYVSFRYEQMMQRESLLSDHSAWRSYPVQIEAWSTGGKTTYRVHVRLTYSSACPCSAALARQLLQQQFEEQFYGHQWLATATVLNWLGSNDTLMAVPHSQRSHADITIELDDRRDDLPIDELITRTEAALNTAVQAAVKRTDEQEFARLNGENLMFCEDAARRLKNAVDAMDGIVDYRIQASHFESLHPHDAVAIVTKGIAGGLTA
ncbi:GTP cyclohydrolase FolE2 [Blastopirellula retiformator]|uniref:GTP cyclohydrolase FolE2 n=1 Tax=Blastopirellula retiformator TaxID=2527970 RepID=A0A5C5VP61_9BACT|nr:GTP cyclohydrolase FolE2 [Blastopirellula retiformator]TWT39715.1 GTP cyclohydrolase FolE2 [Blastopirellula retiformator]